jgi:hypothetical protein
MSWWKMETPDNQRMEIVPGCAQPFSIQFTWNETIKKFLDSDSDYILSLHNDVVADPKTLMRLLSWEKPLVSALVFMRQSPVVPHIWKTYPDVNFKYSLRVKDTRDWFMAHKDHIRFGAFVMEPRPDDALTDVGFTSTSCTLIHRSVLEDMRKNIGDEWFKCDTPYGSGGEDRRFFEEAEKAGYTGYVDRSCIVGHLIGDITASAADFMAWDSVSTFRGIGELDEQVKE